MCAPEVAVGIEGNAVDERTMVSRPEHFTVHEAAVLEHPQTRDPASTGLGHVQPLLAGVEPDFIGEMESVRDDAQSPLIVQGNEPVDYGGAHGTHPVLRP